jgi:hypothetical protein
MKGRAQKCVIQREEKAGRIPTAPTEKIAGMVQGHKGHDRAAQEIDGV